MDYNKAMNVVNNEIYNERKRQNIKWGYQEHTDAEWLVIAMEEVGEVCQAVQQGGFASKETDASDTYKELIQAAAVLSAWAEQVLRDKKE